MHAPCDQSRLTVVRVRKNPTKLIHNNTRVNSCVLSTHNCKPPFASPCVLFWYFLYRCRGEYIWHRCFTNSSLIGSDWTSIKYKHSAPSSLHVPYRWVVHSELDLRGEWRHWEDPTLLQTQAFPGRAHFKGGAHGALWWPHYAGGSDLHTQWAS